MACKQKLTASRDRMFGQNAVCLYSFLYVYEMAELCALKKARTMFVLNGVQDANRR